MGESEQESRSYNDESNNVLDRLFVPVGDILSGTVKKAVDHFSSVNQRARG